MAELTPYQRDILIKTILGEARGEGDTGMAAVAHNVLNRAASGKYSSDPAEVALQPKQYSTWNSGEGGNNPGQFKPGTEAYEHAAQIVDAVATGQIPDMTGGALFYHAKGVNPSWSSGVNKNGTLNVGNHVFYPSRPTPPGEIPQVASALDTQRQAPVPASVEDRVTARNTAVSPLQSALDRMATARRNQVTPASVEDRVTARNKAPVAASPLQQATRRAALGANQSYAGQTDKPITLTSPGAIDATVSGLKTDTALAAAMKRLQTQKQSASDKVRGNEAQTRNIATPVATIPTTQKPATRVVQSVPVQPKPAPQQSYAGQERIGPQWSGPSIPGPSSAPKVADRLAASAGVDFNANPSIAAPIQSGGLSRDALARKLAYNTTAMSQPVPPPITQTVKIAPSPQGRPAGFSIQQPVRANPIVTAAVKPAQPLKIVVNGGATAKPSSSPLQLAGYTNDGKGGLISNETGAKYYERHLR